MRRRPPGRKAPRRAPPNSLEKSVIAADVIDRDADGELFVRPTWAAADSASLRLAPAGPERLEGVLGLGDRLLVRLTVDENGAREARLIKRLGQSAHRILGVVRLRRGEARVEPVDRRSRGVLQIGVADARELSDGDLVLVQVDGSVTRPNVRRARLISVLGREDDSRAASLIAQYALGVPTGFSAESLREAAAALPPTPTGRRDLRDLPLVTIDPPDARDHDDAVFAAADDDPRNQGGWVVWVAIADVGAYVHPGSALDRDARHKGNSVYFPDRVEPMLPEALSAGLCSLNAGETRACLAVRMVFDASGRKRLHRFERGLMQSAASLSYEQAQAAIDGRPDDVAGPLLDGVLRPLWAAYGALLEERRARSPLEIASSERKVTFSPDGRVRSIERRLSLPAHRLIEEMMIQANVCAAETLERRRRPLIFRVHDAPSKDKLKSLKDFLATLGMPWTLGEAARTGRFNQLLAATREGPHGEIVNEVVLRTQMQAVYATENIGHFGLNLDRYAHFTSPIRRYADLTVHRALIAALELGDNVEGRVEIVQLSQIAEHVTMTERRAMAAEREAQDRYVAAFMADRIGAAFSASITGVTRFGLFLRLDESGADGLAPISSLGEEYFHHDETAHCLVGERTGSIWRLGAKVEVRLREASPVTGGLLFEVLTEPEPPQGGPGRRMQGAGHRERRRWR